MAKKPLKWTEPATSGEVAQALLGCRVAMVHLYGMIIRGRTGNNAGFDEAAEAYSKADDELQKLVEKIGGLNDPAD